MQEKRPFRIVSGDAPWQVPIRVDENGLVLGKDVVHVTGISRSTIRRHGKVERFPLPIEGSYPRKWKVDDIWNWLRVNRGVQWRPWTPPGGWPLIAA